VTRDLDLDDYDDRIEGYRREIVRLKHELAEATARAEKLAAENKQLRELFAGVVSNAMRRQA
jgi:prefoldin subunit 5